MAVDVEAWGGGRGAANRDQTPLHFNANNKKELEKKNDNSQSPNIGSLNLKDEIEIDFLHNQSNEKRHRRRRRRFFGRPTSSSWQRAAPQK